MTGGPTGPLELALAANGTVFPGIAIGASNSRRRGPMWQVNGGVQTASNIWITFQFPKTLPSGQCKCDVIGSANAGTGTARYVPAWASVAEGENWDTITLNSEGTQALVWSGGDADDLKVMEFNMDADTPVAGEFCYLRLQADPSWSLAVTSSWLATLVWE